VRHIINSQVRFLAVPRGYAELLFHELRLLADYEQTGSLRITSCLSPISVY
jgi:hypothetical protein